MKKRDKLESYSAETCEDYEGPDVVLVNDVRVMVFLEEIAIGKKKVTGKRREIYFFYFWFHTAFMSPAYPLVLSKLEVDRNRKWKRSPFGKLKSLTIDVSFALV